MFPLQLGGGWMIVPFPTVHRVPSQGYIVYYQRRVLKDEYRKLAGPEIGALVKQGVDVHDITITPEIAYTGKIMYPFYCYHSTHSH